MIKEATKFLGAIALTGWMGVANATIIQTFCDTGATCTSSTVTGTRAYVNMDQAGEYKISGEFSWDGSRGVGNAKQLDLPNGILFTLADGIELTDYSTVTTALTLNFNELKFVDYPGAKSISEIDFISTLRNMSDPSSSFSDGFPLFGPTDDPYLYRTHYYIGDFNPAGCSADADNCPYDAPYTKSDEEVALHGDTLQGPSRLFGLTTFATFPYCSYSGIGYLPEGASTFCDFDVNIGWEITATAYSEPVPEVASVPVPATLWLFPTALIGLIGFNKRPKAA
jgi:hypothetical protein